MKRNAEGTAFRFFRLLGEVPFVKIHILEIQKPLFFTIFFVFNKI